MPTATATIPRSTSIPLPTGDPQRPPPGYATNPFVGPRATVQPLPSSNPAPIPSSADPQIAPANPAPFNAKPLPSVPANYPSGIINPGPRYTIPKSPTTPSIPVRTPSPPVSTNPAPIPSSAPRLPMPIGAGAGVAQVARNAVNASTAAARAGLGTTAVGAVASAGVSIALGADPKQAIAGAAGAAVGGVAGGFVGGAIGSIGGPAGIAVGAAIGQVIGSFAGGALAGGIPQSLSPANQGARNAPQTPVIYPPNGVAADGTYRINFSAQSEVYVYSTGETQTVPLSFTNYGTWAGSQLSAALQNLQNTYTGIWQESPNTAGGPIRIRYVITSLSVSEISPGTQPATQPQPVPRPDNSPIALPTDAKGNQVATSPAPAPSHSPTLSPAPTPSPSPVPAATPTAAPNPYPIPFPVPIPGLSPSPAPTLQPAPAPALTPTPNVYPPSITNPQPGSTSGPDRTPTPVKSTPQTTTPFGIQPGTDTRPSPLPNPGQAPNPKPVQNSTPDNQGKLKTTPEPEPEPPTLPSTRPRNGDCCDPLGGGGGDNELLRKIAKAVGADDFPATLPLLAGSQQETVSNIPELVVWSVKCLDSVIGLFPAEIEIITGEGTKKQVKLETVSHALEELFAALVVVAEDADAAVNIGARTAVEAIQAKISARQTGEVAEAIAKFLGFTGQAKQRQIKIGFTPAAAGVDNKLQNQEMADFLKPSTQSYVGYECVEKDELLPIIKRILQDSEIARAALFHPLKPNPKDAQEQGITGEYLRKMKKRDPIKPTAEEKAWDKFKEQVKKTGAEIDEKKMEK